MTTSTTKKTTLRSNDLSCPSCIGKIENALRKMDGVSHAEVKFNTGRILVEHDPAVAPVSELIKVVKSIGYTATASAF